MRILSANFCSLLVLIGFVCFAHRVESVAQGALRFYRNGDPTTTQAWSSGIVEVYYSGSWGNICDDLDFGQTEATVICHQFGYSGTSSYTDTGSSTLYGTDSRDTALEDVSCSYSSYKTITQCSFSTTSTCDDNKDVIVTCYSTRIWNSPTTGDIRLTSGTYSNEGLLEVYCNGEWGTVCDDSFSFNDAVVACRQLGYNDYYNYDHLLQQGLSSQSIWLDALYSCSSSDSCLTSCQGCPSRENHNCFHFEDVTLECEYDSSDGRVFTNQGNLCNITESESDNSISSAAVAGAIIGVIIVFIICIAIFTVPFCICCCLGVGVGAASSSRPHTRVVTNTASPAATTAVVTTTQETFSEQPAYPQQPAAAYPAPPPAYSQDPPKEYPPQAGYPQQGGYPPQGYPPQVGYPPQGYPAEGYPSKQ